MRRVGRQRNAAAMFCYGGRRGEREGLGSPEVRVAGRGSETEGIGFFLSFSGSIYVMKEKMTRRTPIHRLT